MYKQIYIGLGGIGTRTLADIRKQLYTQELSDHATYSDRDRAFLSIDSCHERWHCTALWSHLGKNLSLNERECLLMSPDPINLQAPNVTPWLFSPDTKTKKKQEDALNSLLHRFAPGAQQRRRYGRLLFAANADRIRDAIQRAILRASMLNECEVAVFHVFCSLGGGTGSGGIVDLVTMIRQLYPNSGTHPIHVYVYMADERGLDDSALEGYFFENQYCALRDLDNLASGVLRPHSMIQHTRDSIGERTEPNPFLISSIHLSTNIDSFNRLVRIPEQIRRTATWALKLATLSEGCNDATILRIINGVDSYVLGRGEPCDKSGTFVARSNYIGAHGFARWAAPLEELVQLAAFDIQLNSCRQMIYNYREENGAYLPQKGSLPGNVLASYYRISAYDFTQEREIITAWKNWTQNNKELQAILSGKTQSYKYKEVESCFEESFQNSVATENEADPLSPLHCKKLLSDRIEQNYEHVTNLFPSSDDVVQRYCDFIHSELTRDWEQGRLGLEQVAEVIDYGISHLAEYETQISADGSATQPGGMIETSIQERTALLLQKLNSLSWFERLLGKHKMIQGQLLENLIELYANRTRHLQITRALQWLQALKERIQGFNAAIRNIIDTLSRLEFATEREYDMIPLRRYLFDGATPPRDIAHEYDYDPTYKQMLHHVHTNMDTSYGASIEGNASELRREFLRTICSKQPSGLFHCSTIINHGKLNACTKLAFWLAREMLREADKRYHTRNMDGIKSRSEDLRSAEFNEKLRRMIDSAALSYAPDRTTLAAEIAYRNMYRSRKSWVFSFPMGFKIDGVEHDAVELKRRVQEVIGREATDDSVFLRQTQDTTQVSVYITEYAQMARNAAIVSCLAGHKREMDARGSEIDNFWCNIDDEATKLMCPLTFPNKYELAVMREGAMWFARQLPNLFIIDNECAKVYSSDNERVIHEINLISDLPNTTMFAYNVQREVSRAIVTGKSITTDELRARYREELDSQPDDEKKSHFQRVIDDFIEKTLARIELAQIA